MANFSSPKTLYYLVLVRIYDRHFMSKIYVLPGGSGDPWGPYFGKKTTETEARTQNHKIDPVRELTT